MKNRITELLGIKHPIIQGGMIWCSGWELASAVSNNGGLGTIGSGSMYPEILEEHVQKCKANTDKPFAVNIPLIYPQIEDHIDIILREKVPVVISSAGNPKKWTPLLKENGIKVIHVVPGLKFALKAQEAGVDAIVAEGFEAGGHNGKDETTTFCLIPKVADKITVPLVAAGGINSGKSMLAAFILGADGVQIGSRFVASHESSAHDNFKQAVVQAKEGDTHLTLKELGPVRLIKNPFYDRVQDAYKSHFETEQLKELLGRGRAKKGMFNGDLENGELEIGQICSDINSIKTSKEIIEEIMRDYYSELEKVKSGIFALPK